MKIITKKWIVHTIFRCLMCDWYCEDYKIAEKEAKKHIRKADHEVQGEVAYGVEIHGV